MSPPTYLIRGKTRDIQLVDVSGSCSLSHMLDSVSFTNLLLEHPELMDAYERGRLSVDALDDRGRRNFHYLNRELCWYYSAQWYQFETGAIGPDEWWESLYLIRHSWICHPGVQQWWQQYRDGTSPPFRRFLDAEVGALSENSSREQ